MNSEKNYGKGFIPIETEIHVKLNWDYDLIVNCFEQRRGVSNFFKEDLMLLIQNFIRCCKTN